MRQQKDKNLERHFGVGWIVIPYRRRFNNIHCFILFYSILLIGQGIMFALVDLSNENFRNKYYVTNTVNLILVSTGLITSCVGAVFLLFYGSNVNTPRILAVSSSFVGVAALLFSCPYFAGRDYQLETEIEDLCQVRMGLDTCKDALSSFKTNYIFFNVMGQIIQGITVIPVFIHAKLYIDDNAEGHSIGTYLGIGEASTVLGYALGTVIGAPQIQPSVNSTSMIKPQLRTDISLWLQTWWFDFLIAAFVVWSTVIPFLCFPPSLPGTAEVKAKKREQSDWIVNNPEDQEFGTSIKDFFASVLILIKNPLLMILSVTRSLEYIVFSGYGVFLAKYLETQYRLTTKMATTISGIVLVPGNALGQLLGGIIISKLQMSCKAIMRFTITTSIVAIILLMFMIFVRCETVQFAGITENYEGTGQIGNLTAPCNSHCGCSSSFHIPICGRDNVEYFSPCYAGCAYRRISKKRKLYHNCSCITKGLSIQDDQGYFNDAISGKCDTKCHKLPLFISFIFSTIVFSTLSFVPSIVILLRISPEKQRCLTLGVAFVTLRIIGLLPGQYLFKTTEELSCIVRAPGICGNKGICKIFSKIKMTCLFIMIGFVCKGLIIFLTAVAFRMYSRRVEEFHTNTLSTCDEESKGKLEVSDISM